MDTFARGEVWGDGAGGAKALLVTYAAGGGAAATWPIFVGHPCRLLCKGTIGGTVPTSVELMVQVSLDGGATWENVQAEYIGTDGFVAVRDAEYRLAGAADPPPIAVTVPAECVVQILAKRTGGGVDTTLYLEAHPKDPLSSFAGLGGGAALPESVVSDVLLCFDDGAAPPAALAIAAGPGWTDTDGEEWHPSGAALYGVALVSVTVAGGETAIQCRIRVRRAGTAAPEFLALATNSVVAGVEDVDAHIVDLPLTASDWLLHLPVMPGMEYAIDFRRTAGGPEALAWFIFWR